VTPALAPAALAPSTLRRTENRTAALPAATRELEQLISCARSSATACQAVASDLWLAPEARGRLRRLLGRAAPDLPRSERRLQTLKDDDKQRRAIGDVARSELACVLCPPQSPPERVLSASERGSDELADLLVRTGEFDRRIAKHATSVRPWVGGAAIATSAVRRLSRTGPGCSRISNALNTPVT
jgi:hypothetical protein